MRLLCYVIFIVLLSSAVSAGLTIDSPQGTLIESSNILLMFGSDEILTCSYLYEGREYQLGKSRSFTEPIQGSLLGNVLKNGRHDIFLTCKNQAEEQINEELSFKVDDKEAPVIFTEPEDGETIISPEQFIQLRIRTDEIADVTYSVNGRKTDVFYSAGRDRTRTITYDLIAGMNEIIIHATDMQGNLRSEKISFTLVNADAPKTLEELSYTWDVVEEGQAALWQLSSNQYALSILSMTFDKRIRRPTIRLNRGDLPPPSGKVIEQFTLSGEGFSGISHAVLTFQLPKSFANKNITLYHYDGLWTPLATMHIGQNNQFLVYRATSPELGTFTLMEREAIIQARDRVIAVSPETNQQLVLIVAVIGALILIILGLIWITRVRLHHHYFSHPKAWERELSKKPKVKVIIPLVPKRPHKEEIPDVEGLPSMSSSRAIPPEVKDFVKHARALNLGDEEIKTKLLEQGWSSSIVDAALH
ncbi:MAG: hypothetical protein ABIH34_07015 [Nanoarchaeota archaeon]